jgi:hypothetical protein
MPRNKTFRKRKHDKIQKGGAFNMSDSTFPKIQSTNLTKYYAYVVKTRKTGGGGGGGGGVFVIAVSSALPEYEYKTTIIDEAQKQLICNDATSEKTKIIKSTGAGAGNLKQFVEDESKEEVITIFELNDGNNATLNDLTITKENVKWDDYVVC